MSVSPRPEGEECFGIDACECWGKSDLMPDPLAHCNPGQHHLGEVLTGILNDPMFRSGWDWPPNQILMGQNDIGADCFSCRRFTDTRRDGQTAMGTVSLSASKHGGVDIIGLKVEPYLNPAQGSFSVCTSNLLVYCTGKIVNPGEGGCMTSAWYEIGGGRPEPGIPEKWYNTDPASRMRFDNLYVRSKSDNVPDLQGDPYALPVEIGTIALKRQALAVALGRSEFRILLISSDAQPLGLWVMHVDYGANKPAGALPLPGAVTRACLSKTTDRLTASIEISSIRMFCTLVLTHLRDDTRAAANHYIEPTARFQIVIGLRLNITAPDGAAIRTWDGNTIPLVIDDGTGVVTPPVDAVRLYGPDDRPFRMPSVVEWRGFLGGHSVPTALQQRRTIEHFGLHGGIAHETADAFPPHSIPVPAWPYRADSGGSDPTGMMRGAMEVGFIGRP
jgi:hypothetical protein